MQNFNHSFMNVRHPFVAMAITLIVLFTSCDGQRWTEHTVGNFVLVEQRGGPTLGYSPTSGIHLLTVDGYAFKDLNRNDTLDPYEDLPEF